MVKKKGKSKRQTLKQKYKIERRVKEVRHGAHSVAVFSQPCTPSPKLASLYTQLTCVGVLFVGVQHHRKLKKEANRNKKAGVVVHKAKPKDPGIPNSWPFKDDLLKQIER